MGGYTSGGHYIYYCGQKSLRRNGVDVVNKESELQYLDAI